MSWDEWIFDKAYKFVKRRNRTEKNPAVANLSSHQKTLEVGFEAISGVPVHIDEAQDFTGFYKNHLFIPAHIDLLENKYLNYKLYWLLLCFHAKAVTEINKLKWNPLTILEEVRGEFPGLEPCIEGLKKLEGRENGHFKTIPWLGNPPILDSVIPTTSTPFEKDQTLQSESSTQSIEKKGPNVAEAKELKDSEENPLIHMFEKVNTIESYQGGNKTKQAEDSLENIKEALEEVQLRNVIRSSERTPGLIKSNSIIESNGLVEDPSQRENKIDLVFYPEWNQSKRMYRQDWCAVRVITPEEQSHNKKKTPEGQKLKQRFESLFNHFLWEGNQQEGTELDLRPIIENQISRIKGGTLKDRIYLKRIDQIKDFQVLIMMDESLSTESFLGKESVLGMMKDSIGDLAQAFESSPEQVSIMSFFSESRLKCTVKMIKDFSESLEIGQARLYSCKPQGYTRIGVAIRHAISVMKESKSKRKCIVLLTDAKPTDIDRYEGRYGMDDVRKTIEELKNQRLELIVVSYAPKESDRFERMFSKRTPVFHATTRKEMTHRLMQVVEKMVF
jgi:nitric oxide reductase NorD protein